MMKVLITGATGNVGTAVIQSLQTVTHQLDVYAGVRDLKADAVKLANYKINFLQFDFTNPASYDSALNQCNILFLLRPPQISEVAKYFKPIINICKKNGVKHIVFLSVQGVEKSRIIPHHQIERLIVDSKIPYTFLRPAYFMQNFTTTLLSDLLQKKQIFLPAGNAQFTLIDVRDIGAVSAAVLSNVAAHQNQSYELTCQERFTFSEMAQILSQRLGTSITFQSPNLIHFFWTKRKEKMPVMLILVMIMLHYFPRFQKAPQMTDWVMKLTGKLAITFEQFVDDHKKILNP
jgi:uncharacterized protein YbjT (DUF2867 family)